MKRPHTKFHAHTMRDLLGTSLKKPNLLLGLNVSCSTVFLFSSIFYWNYNNRHWYSCKFSCILVITVGLLEFWV